VGSGSDARLTPEIVVEVGLESLFESEEHVYAGALNVGIDDCYAIACGSK
jgi:hypothetical protein